MVVKGAKRPRSVLLSVRAAAARYHFQTLDFLAHGFVEDGVGEEDQPARAGVGVVVLTSFHWTEYARLCGVHSLQPFCGPGSGVCNHSRGHFLLSGTCSISHLQ